MLVLGNCPYEWRIQALSSFKDLEPVNTTIVLALWE